MKDIVSIIIPVYSAEETLSRCVESLVYGTYPNLEIILVEDCSPDNSWEVCKKLRDRHPCVKIYRNNQNSGPSATRNRGLKEMTGKFLMFVDSDDWVEPDFVDSFVITHEKYQPDLIVCGYWNHDEVQNATTDCFVWADEFEAASVNLKDSLIALYEGRLLQQIWNKFFLTDIIKKYNLSFDTSIRMGEDFRFLLTYLEKVEGNQLVQINKPLYHYIRCSGNSLMSQFGREKIEEPLKNLDKLYKLIGMDEAERRQKLSEDYSAQKELWAYLIIHNMGMNRKEKKHMILSLDPENGEMLYRNNMALYTKERISVALKRLGLR